ncbi:MAG TPA: 50S ribosomal protein L25/general stress protein Ctc [Gemmatimonadaceae bacterium]|jgi:large subunit ribosomal protein L25|nr:50S ribosomal protein L25/general stress protein Ctc [Gemmatimonadaceae bacterium]
MATVQLSASPRDTVGKGAARSLRSAGKIPAVIYGHAREPQSLAIPTREFEKLLERVSAESTVIELDVGGTVARTLIREIQRHPFKKQILHIDFQELVAGEKVTVNVPIVLVGTPEGVRLSGGILSQVLSELSILVDPVNIPRRIEADVTNLTIGHSLHVSDLTVPEGVEIVDEPESTVANVSAPKAVEETAPVAEAAAEGEAEPELIRKTKDEEEEGESK